MLEIDHVSMAYGARKVLDDVAFAVRPGRLTGFVGGNGAGKTTTMRCILGLVRPDEGRVLIDGRPVSTRDRARFGYMPEERGLYPKMRVLEQVAYFGELHGMSASAATASGEELLRELGLGERLGDKLEDLSLGNQQRAQIAATLVHDPEFLILDEPFSGLDPLAVDAVLAVLQRSAQRGAPVLFSSHQLDVVERLADDLVIISSGTIRARGERDELLAAHSRGLYRVELDGDASWVRDAPGIELVAAEGPVSIVRASGEDAAQALLAEAMRRGPVRAFGPHVEKLSAIYREVV